MGLNPVLGHSLHCSYLLCLDLFLSSILSRLYQAILGRKLVVDDMHKLMYKIAQLSVTSDSDTTRQQCRQVLIHSYTHTCILTYLESVFLYTIGYGTLYYGLSTGEKVETDSGFLCMQSQVQKSDYV